MQNVHGGFMIYSLICFTLRLLSLATVLAYAIFCCKTRVKMSTAVWKNCATTQVRVAKPGRDTAPLGGGGVTTASAMGGCGGDFEDKRDVFGGM